MDSHPVALADGRRLRGEQFILCAGGHARGFITVDDYFRTSAPHIFAAGDITGRMMLMQSATDEAWAAAENAVLGTGQRRRHDLVPHGGFTDPEYGSVGLTEAQARRPRHRGGDGVVHGNRSGDH